MTAPQGESNAAAVTCADFRDLVKQELTPVLEQYGFTVSSERVAEHDCGVEWRNRTTVVTVLREAGGDPWIQISRITVDAPGRDVARTSLDFIAKVLGMTIPRMGRAASRNDAIEWLHSEAKILKFANPVLRGEFDLMQKTGPLMEVWEKELNKRYFGSESGEGPM